MRQIGQTKWDCFIPILGGLGNSSLFFHCTDAVGLTEPLADAVGLRKFCASNVVAVNPVMIVLSSLERLCFLILESSACDILACCVISSSLTSSDDMTFLKYILDVLPCRFQYKK